MCKFPQCAQLYTSNESKRTILTMSTGDCVLAFYYADRLVSYQSISLMNFYVDFTAAEHHLFLVLLALVAQFPAVL